MFRHIRIPYFLPSWRGRAVAWLGIVLVSLTPFGVNSQIPPRDPARVDAPSKNGVRPNTSNEGLVTLNFLNSNLDDVVKGVSGLTGMRFMIPSDLKAKTVSLVTQQPIPSYQVYSALLSMLRANRLVAVENDGIINIVPETDAWTQAPLQTPKDPDSQLVSKVIKFNYITATVAANIIRPLLSQKGFPLVPNNNNNTLVVVDYVSNLKNLETILNSLDQPDQMLPTIFPINHLSALDAESALKSMLQSAPLGSSSGFTSPVMENIFADVPNNRLLIRADAKRLIYIAQLLAFIDIPRRSASLINIYPLKYTNAEKMAKTLSTLLVNKSSSGQSSTRAASNPAPASVTNNPNSTGTQVGGEVLDLPAGGVNIQADNATNSLIIAAPENLYRNIVEIVRKLDVRRRQIFVEILIADVHGQRINELGVQWMAAKGLTSTNTGVIGSTNLDTPAISTVAQNPLATGSGITVGLVKGSINVPGVGTILNLGMLARALETQYGANILSSPNLLVLNNEESKLLVGSNIPVVTGQYTQSSTASSSPFQTIERRDVGVTLRIKPQIMDSGVILLDLYQEVSDILSVTTQGPTTSKRSLESKVLLDDGQIMVLGGLISENENDETSRVPILGQIPLLGKLFSYTKKTHKKSNLLLFIRPVVLKDQDDSSNFTDKKYQAMFNQLPYEGNDLNGWFDKNSTVLPSKTPYVAPNQPVENPKLDPKQSLPSDPVPSSPFVPEPLVQKEGNTITPIKVTTEQPSRIPVSQPPNEVISPPPDLPVLISPPTNINEESIVASLSGSRADEDRLSNLRRIFQQRKLSKQLERELDKAQQ